MLTSSFDLVYLKTLPSYLLKKLTGQLKNFIVSGEIICGE